MNSYQYLDSFYAVSQPTDILCNSINSMTFEELKGFFLCVSMMNLLDGCEFLSSCTEWHIIEPEANKLSKTKQNLGLCLIEHGGKIHALESWQADWLPRRAKDKSHGVAVVVLVVCGEALFADLLNAREAILRWFMLEWEPDGAGFMALADPDRQ